jgi:hypothetical protein
MRSNGHSAYCVLWCLSPKNVVMIKFLDYQISYGYCAEAKVFASLVVKRQSILWNQPSLFILFAPTMMRAVSAS